MLHRFYVNFKELLTLDVRSLALFRIGIGICLIYEAVTRWLYRGYLYGEEGFLPLADRMKMPFPHSGYGLLQWTESSLWLDVFFLIFIGASILFFLGFLTRAAHFILILAWLSIEARNPILDQVGSAFLGLILLWSFPMPLSHCLSLDALLKKRKQFEDRQFLGIANFAFLLQLFTIYWFAFLHKLTPIWWSHGTGVYFAMQGESYTKYPGRWLLDHPVLMIYLTRLSQILRSLGPFLFFIPGRFRLPSRLLGLAIFIGLHLIFYICLSLGAFPWICIFAWCALIPREVWNFAQRKATGIKSHIQVQSFEKHWPLHLLFIFLFGLSMLSNVLNFHKENDYTNTPLEEFINDLQLRQSWRMYAFPETGLSPWLVAEAEFEGQSNQDLFSENKVLSFELPPYLSDRYPIEPIRRIEHVMSRYWGRKKLARRMAQSLCFKGTRRTGDDAPLPDLVRIHLLQALTPMPYLKVEKKEIEREVLAEIDCKVLRSKESNTKKIKIISQEKIETGTKIANNR